MPPYSLALVADAPLSRHHDLNRKEMVNFTKEQISNVDKGHFYLVSLQKSRFSCKKEASKAVTLPECNNNINIELINENVCGGAASPYELKCVGFVGVGLFHHNSVSTMAGWLDV